LEVLRRTFGGTSYPGKMRPFLYYVKHNNYYTALEKGILSVFLPQRTARSGSEGLGPDRGNAGEFLTP
jgi:hypothetical protein